MKPILLPMLATLALAGVSFDALAHSYGNGDRHHGPPAHGHGVPPGHRKHHALPPHVGHAPSYRGPVVVVPAPRYYGYSNPPRYRPDYRHRHYDGCGHHGYRDSRAYGIAFGVTPYDSWLDIRIGY